MITEQIELIDAARRVDKPEGYRGLHAFHKYWGKKPLEPLAFLVERLTLPGALVVDPFMGSCSAGVESVRVGRRFIGIDLNPISVRLARLLLAPPTVATVQSGFERVRDAAKQRIESSYYSDSAGGPITHYLWDKDRLAEMWIAKQNHKERKLYVPTDADLHQCSKYENYHIARIRPLRFFNNSRINANANLSLNDLFTGRALRNLDILLESISELPTQQRGILELTLTAAVGQMSKMVFAISGRGKVSGTVSKKTEVGSWVIGFWRPHRHFEINVWNCFERRVKKLISALRNAPNTESASFGGIAEVVSSEFQCALEAGDSLELLNSIPDQSIDLLVTDPPHGDRIPYLELSELWNSVLGLDVDFSSEIVVSNAKERGKNLEDYSSRLKSFAELATRKIKTSGSIVVLFNTRDTSSWDFLSDLEIAGNESGLRYHGNFPLIYSAGSVVQDNRLGSLKTDFALVFSTSNGANLNSLESLANWSYERPSNLRRK